VAGADRSWPRSCDELRATFDSRAAYTVGIEDEVMLLAVDSLELCPSGLEVLALLGGDPRFKLELPASQIEITTPPCQGVSEAAAALLDARRALAEAVDGMVCPAAAGVHPFSSGVGELNQLPSYERTVREYGQVARRQLVCALQVHVAAGDAGRCLAVYNAARSYLPLIAALAANAPFYEGKDTGLASVRPKLGALLPRQGIPPVMESWQAYAEILRWGFVTGAFPTAQTWWWELRLHPEFGTLEFRVPDGQTRVKDAVAVAAVIQALVVWLGERHDRGEQLAVHRSWQIDENRWSACRYGVEGDMLELESAMRRPTRTLLIELLDTLAPTAMRLNSLSALEHAHRMVHINGTLAQRRVAARGDTRAVAAWLVDRFVDPEI
jgi:carboxylate-amine ligase